MHIHPLENCLYGSIDLQFIMSVNTPEEYEQALKLDDLSHFVS